MATEGGGLVKRMPQQVQAANLMILQRRDDAVSEILAMATYVVIYVFEPVTKQWERKEVSCVCGGIGTGREGGENEETIVKEKEEQIRKVGVWGLVRGRVGCLCVCLCRYVPVMVGKAPFHMPQ